MCCAKGERGSDCGVEVWESVVEIGNENWNITFLVRIYFPKEIFSWGMYHMVHMVDKRFFLVNVNY